jgi:hypothetical protein
MKRLIVIVEGDSEEEFVNSILTPYLNSKEIYSIDCFKIKHSKGGLSKYSHLKKDILNTIYESDVVVTTLIDFYALPSDFPNFLEAKEIPNKSNRLDFLENSIKEEIESTQNKLFPNLIPYIQLHEFEALIFSSIDGIKELFEKSEADFDELEDIITQYPNPENINDKPNTAPSKRLLANIKGYNKVLDGVSILDEIGLEKILNKCPRFNEWLNKLVQALIN